MQQLFVEVSEQGQGAKQESQQNEQKKGKKENKLKLE